MQKDKYIYIIILLSGVVGVIAYMHSWYYDENRFLSLQQGDINLENWDGEQIALKGEWQFYPNTYYSEINNDSGYYIREIEHEWQRDKVMDYSPVGYGTYLAEIQGLDPEQIYAFWIVDQLTSYNVYINDKHIVSEGDVRKHIPSWQSQTVPFKANQNGTIAIAIEIDNVYYNRGGFWSALEIGIRSNIHKNYMRGYMKEIFIFAGIFIVGIYFFGVFIYYEEKRTAMAFSVFCMDISAYILFTGRRIIYYMAPELSWFLQVRIEFLLKILILPCYILFILNLTVVKNIDKINKVTKYIIFSIMGIYMILPMKVIFAFYPLYKIMGLLIFFVVFIYFVVTYFREQKRNFLLVVAFTAVFISAVKEVFYPTAISHLPYGVFVMVICFALATIKQVSNLTERNQILESKNIHDQLTGVYTKAYLLKYVEEYIKEESSNNGILLFLDVDKFKVINDRFGHAVGDVMLQMISKRVNNIIREEDILARYGGDEFVLFMKEGSIEYAEKIACRIIQSIQQPFTIDGNTCFVGISIGIASCNDEHDIKVWIEQADQAMYVAKKEGRNRYTVA